MSRESCWFGKKKYFDLSLRLDRNSESREQQLKCAHCKLKFYVKIDKLLTVYTEYSYVDTAGLHPKSGVWRGTIYLQFIFKIYNLFTILYLKSSIRP